MFVCHRSRRLCALLVALLAAGTAGFARSQPDDAASGAAFDRLFAHLDADDTTFDLTRWRRDTARLDEFLSVAPREGHRWAVELREPSWVHDDTFAVLERVVGRTCGRDCDATLGDARCRVDVSEFPGLACDRRWETCVGG